LHAHTIETALSNAIYLRLSIATQKLRHLESRWLRTKNPACRSVTTGGILNNN